MPTFTDEMGRRLRNLTIRSGSHGSEAKKFCIMEAVNFIAGQPHSDQPVCVSDAITDFMIGINDSRKTDKERNKLKKIVPEIMGTRPTQTRPASFYFNGATVDGFLEEPKPTKGYLAGERRRRKLLGKEVARLGVGHFNPSGDSGDGYPTYEAEKISTKDAIEIARKLVAVKNKA